MERPQLLRHQTRLPRWQMRLHASALVGANGAGRHHTRVGPCQRPTQLRLALAPALPRLQQQQLVLPAARVTCGPLASSNRLLQWHHRKQAMIAVAPLKRATMMRWRGEGTHVGSSLHNNDAAEHETVSKVRLCMSQSLLASVRSRLQRSWRSKRRSVRSNALRTKHVAAKKQSGARWKRRLHVPLPRRRAQLSVQHADHAPRASSTCSCPMARLLMQIAMRLHWRQRSQLRRQRLLQPRERRRPSMTARHAPSKQLYRLQQRLNRFSLLMQHTRARRQQPLRLRRL